MSDTNQGSSSGIQQNSEAVKNGAGKNEVDFTITGEDNSNYSNEKTPSAYDSDDSTKKPGFFKSFIDDFRPFQMESLDPNLTDAERAAIAASQAPLQRNLKNRHVQMIAIGGCIGTGLFVGSGKALATGGPASLIIAYSIIGSMIFCMVQALGELAVAFPVAGGFLALNSRFVSPTWGFCIACTYILNWITVLPLELVASALTINFWNDSINSDAWVGIFYAVIVFINLFGVKGYGEAEFIFSLIKVIAVIGFVICGIVIAAGGGPQGEYIGAKYWYDPGAFNHGFKGLCTVFVTAAFSFAGTELVGLASAETSNPRKTLPSAIKQVFWRITFFYLTSMVIVSCLVRYDDPKLFGDSSNTASASPFVIAIKNAGINVLPSIMNAVILIAVLSVANSSVFACSRAIASLADQGFAPKIFGYIDRKGRPLGGILSALIIGLLCFLAGSSAQGQVFTWMMAIAGLSAVLNWGTICFSHLRFRRAMQLQGRSLDELSFVSMTGIYGSIWGFTVNFLILIAEFWVSVWPPAREPSAEYFFENYLTIPVLIFAFFGWITYCWISKKEIILFIRAKDIDLDTGRRIEDIDVLQQEVAEEKAYLATKPLYYRIWKFWC